MTRTCLRPCLLCLARLHLSMKKRKLISGVRYPSRPLQYRARKQKYTTQKVFLSTTQLATAACCVRVTLKPGLGCLVRAFHQARLDHRRLSLISHPWTGHLLVGDHFPALLRHGLLIPRTICRNHESLMPADPSYLLRCSHVVGPKAVSCAFVGFTVTVVCVLTYTPHPAHSFEHASAAHQCPFAVSPLACYAHVSIPRNIPIPLCSYCYSSLYLFTHK